MLRRDFIVGFFSSLYERNQTKKIADEINSLSREYIKLTDALNRNLKYFSLPNEQSAAYALQLSDMHGKFQELFRDLSTQMKKGIDEQN